MGEESERERAINQSEKSKRKTQGARSLRSPLPLFFSLLACICLLLPLFFGDLSLPTENNKQNLHWPMCRFAVLRFFPCFSVVFSV